MKILIIILLAVLPIYSIDGLKQRLKRVQQSQEQILQKEDIKTPQVPSDVKSVIISDEQPIEGMPRHGDRITRLEVSQQYMQKDLDKAVASLQETREILIEVVTTLEKATKVTEVQTDKTDKAALWLNIILGIVSILAGGGGVFAWKNKNLVWKPKEKSLSDTQSVKS